jgi:ribosomal protein S8E
VESRRKEKGKEAEGKRNKRPKSIGSEEIGEAKGPARHQFLETPYSGFSLLGTKEVPKLAKISEKKETYPQRKNRRKTFEEK